MTTPLRRSTEERFLAKVHMAADAVVCWPWQAATQPNGYGTFGVRRGATVRAHRFAYEMAWGPIPSGLQVDHLCRNRVCVRPSHLELVTTKTNTLRGRSFAAINAAKIVCTNGHAYTPENTYWWRGWRKCLICRHNYNVAYGKTRIRVR